MRRNRAITRVTASTRVTTSTRVTVFTRVTTAVAVLGGVLAACTGGGGTKAASDPPGPPAAISNRVIRPVDKNGGTLRVLATADCDSWDPQRTSSAQCWNEQRWISRQLVTYAPAPGAAKLAGDLATDVPTSKDLRTWTYTIRPGLAFEDGTPITSRDVKYGIERAFATDVVPGGPGEVVDLLQDPENPYRGPYSDSTPDRLGLSSVQTPDDHTITFRLNRPFADWNLVMASPVSTPVPRLRDTGARYESRPVASGPYRIESHHPGESITLVRNPQWNAQTDPNRPARPDRVEERMGLAPSDIDNRILTDQADIFLDQTGVQAHAESQIVANPSLHADRTADAPTGMLRFLAVLTRVAPFDNIHCRNAVAWAVDKRAQQTARGGATVGGDIASTMLLPPVRSFSWFDLFPSPGGTGDIARAKDELAACGRREGFAVTLATGPASKDVAQAEAVRTSLARVGISVTVEKFDEQQWISVIETPERIHNAKIGLVLAARSSDRPTPYAFLAPVVGGRAIGRENNLNVAELDQPAVNQGLERGIRTGDGDDAAGIWTTLDRTVVASAAYVPLLYDRALNVYSDRLTNVRYSPAFMMTDFAALGVVP
ncbi:ABC transporter substrate-binding protein [Frankia sp. Cppng1_Ct_nod]|uniref:ABC transporter substrate-binding protein n=1 Tax=Frankia sp. Cppng1_Ct_nod TaxID=2897162 RepID=UPI001F5F044E|nr:ABC transporter substrate-binding protein [Frankia sp. Cppng1_Ct_nod]